MARGYVKGRRESVRKEKDGGGKDEINGKSRVVRLCPTRNYILAAPLPRHCIKLRPT